MFEYVPCTENTGWSIKLFHYDISKLKIFENQNEDFIAPSIKHKQNNTCYSVLYVISL